MIDTATEIAGVLHDLRRLVDGDPDALAHRDEILAAKRALIDRLAADESPAPPVCARPGCPRPAARRETPFGRPPIYCSPECRPSYKGRSQAVLVEADQDDDATTWTVRLRRGARVVTVGEDLGRFSAFLLRRDLQAILHPRSAQEGGAIG